MMQGVTMRIEMILIILGTLLLSACASSQTKLIQPTVSESVKTPESMPTPVIKKTIDWSKIDKSNNIVVNNLPKKVTQRYQIDDVIMQAVMADFKVSKVQAMRILAMQGGVQDEGVLIQSAMKKL